MNDEQQWAANTNPMKVGSDDPCLKLQRQWPRKLCNRNRGHAGDHCNESSGSQIVRVWWKESECL